MKIREQIDHVQASTVDIEQVGFSARIRFAVNPIVLQDLLLAADPVDPSQFERIRDHLRVLPVDFAKAEALLPRVRALRNRLSHSNDILDMPLKDLATPGKPQAVTPEELVTQLRAA